MKEVWRTPGTMLCAGLCLFGLSGEVTFSAEQERSLQEQVQQLQQQNELLQLQMQRQQVTIEILTKKMSVLEGHPNEPPLTNVASQEQSAGPAKSALPFGSGKLNVSGEGGVAYLHSQSQGQFPKGEFRLDEAKLFLEAPVWRDVYFFTELSIALREEASLGLRAGELYLDFEDVSRLWGQERQLNLRVGRFYIPFGEEYQERNAIDNPLISHSLTDFWGWDQGLEFYGALENVHYIFAIQNGGIGNLGDYNSDKALTARLGYEPSKWLHLSVSAMRTGDLDTRGDGLSAIWFGNGYFRSLGSNATTFHAQLAEGDMRIRFSRGYLHAAGGYIYYNDNDRLRSNQRDVYYYYLEGVQNLFGKFYAAARWSQIFAHKGFPIVGNGDFVKYQFDDGELTSKLWRMSLGLGYRLSQNLLLKTEYSFEQGDELSGTKRRRQNLFAAEVAFKF